jgi:hypothetical protein
MDSLNRELHYVFEHGQKPGVKVLISLFLFQFPEIKLNLLENNISNISKFIIPIKTFSYWNMTGVLFDPRKDQKWDFWYGTYLSKYSRFSLKNFTVYKNK